MSDATRIRIDHIDHLVLTVADVAATCRFYTQILGLEEVVMNGGRRALRFGSQKLNLHAAGAEPEPKAARPTPGSADVCFITTTPIASMQEHLQSAGVEIVAGPVERIGAIGAVRSLYIRDPDGNLIELSNYQ